MATGSECEGPVRALVVPLHCRRCGYNLYGGLVDGVCPECGMEVWETVLHTVDPAASRLPRLHNPEAVGNALVLMMLSLLVAAIAFTVRPVGRWLERLGSIGPTDFSWWAEVETAIVLGCTLVGILAVRSLAPPRSGREGVAVRRDVQLVGVGLVAGAVLVAIANSLEVAGSVQAWIPDSLRFGLVAPALLGMVGLRRILRLIGLRSRAYRTAHGARQGVKAMMAAVGGTGVGHLIQLIAVGTLATLGRIMATISTLMLLIGLLYMVANVWWIRRSLRRPPPTLESILGKPDGQSPPPSP